MWASSMADSVQEVALSPGAPFATSHLDSRAGVGLLLLLTPPKASSGYSPNVISSCRKNGEL